MLSNNKYTAKDWIDIFNEEMLLKNNDSLSEVIHVYILYLSIYNKA